MTERILQARTTSRLDASLTYLYLTKTSTPPAVKFVKVNANGRNRLQKPAVEALGTITCLGIVQARRHATLQPACYSQSS